MRCPNCGAKFQKTANICFKCGTKLSQIQNASNQDITKAKKEYQPEKIVYTTIFPKDVSYKKTLLLSIFLGIFGAHRYYTKNYFSAILMSFCSAIFLLFMSFVSIKYQGYGPALVSILNSNPVFYFFFNLISVLGALTILFWAMDIIKIATKRFKIPVVLADK